MGATGQSLAALKVSSAMFAESQHDGGSVSGESLLDTSKPTFCIAVVVSRQLDQSAYHIEARVILIKHGFGFDLIWFGCSVFNTMSLS